MGNSIWSNWAGNQALTSLLGGSGLYLALHETDPTVAALLATEVAGGGYARQPITFGAASGKTVVSISAQTFPAMPAVTAAYLAVWDAVSGGHMLISQQLGTWSSGVFTARSIDVPESGQFLVAAGDLAFSV